MTTFDQATPGTRTLVGWAIPEREELDPLGLDVVVTVLKDTLPDLAVGLVERQVAEDAGIDDPTGFGCAASLHGEYKCLPGWNVAYLDDPPALPTEFANADYWIIPGAYYLEGDPERCGATFVMVYSRSEFATPWDAYCDLMNNADTYDGTLTMIAGVYAHFGSKPPTWDTGPRYMDVTAETPAEMAATLADRWQLTRAGLDEIDESDEGYYEEES